MGLEALPLQLALPSGIEVLVVLLIAVLLFGANKIPKLARASGRALGEFHKGREQIQEELQGGGTDDSEDEFDASLDGDEETEAVTATESTDTGDKSGGE